MPLRFSRWGTVAVLAFALLCLVPDADARQGRGRGSDDDGSTGTPTATSSPSSTRSATPSGSPTSRPSASPTAWRSPRAPELEALLLDLAGRPLGTAPTDPLRATLERLNGGGRALRDSTVDRLARDLADALSQASRSRLDARALAGSIAAVWDSADRRSSDVQELLRRAAVALEAAGVPAPWVQVVMVDLQDVAAERKDVIPRS